MQAAQGPAFRPSSLFPEYNGVRAPFPKQQQVFSWTSDGSLTGGGCVYQSGKGGGKTITGSAWIIWIHHHERWRGCTTLIGRESYPSLVTSTADEFFKMVEQMPPRYVRGYSRPAKNSMGYVEWEAEGRGGKTLLCSLSNSDTWESANLGAAWVDEAHRQNARIFGDLMTRLRQPNAPRAALATTNPGGKNFLYDMAHPASKRRHQNWRWIEASSEDNPALPPDYLRRLIDRYGYETPAYRRWVRGESSALEGIAFTEFDPNPVNSVHVIPAFEIPKEWKRGRGLDHGFANPTAVIWGAHARDLDAWFVYNTHYRSGLTVPEHAEIIHEKDAGHPMYWTPADPSMFAAIHTDKFTGQQFSTADDYQRHGIVLTRANNDRKAGLARMMDLIAVDSECTHFLTGILGAPRLFIFDTPENDPLITELSNLEWDRPEGSPNRDQPDDVQKKNDHGYDGLRYLVMDAPPTGGSTEPTRRAPRRREMSSGVYRGY